MDESDKHNVEEKKPDTKEYTLDYSIHIKYIKRAKLIMLLKSRKVIIQIKGPW
jgi:hypothetical protein